MNGGQIFRCRNLFRPSSAGNSETTWPELCGTPLRSLSLDWGMQVRDIGQMVAGKFLAVEVGYDSLSINSVGE